MSKKEKSYFETGELKQEKVYLSAKCYVVTEYYRGGMIKSTGKLCNDIKVEKWQEYYVDGELKWEGYLNNNVRNVNYNLQVPAIEICDSPNGIIYPGTSYRIRIRLEGVHPRDMMVTSNNGIVKLTNKPDEFDFVITPKKEGDLELVLYVVKEQQMYRLGKKVLTVHNR